MKAILISGKKDNGKSTTIQELCRQLKPSKIWQLKIEKLGSILEEVSINKIHNDVFIIEVNKVFILIVAGCPTEINIKITLIIEACLSLNIDIRFIISAKRTSERKEGFNTKKELNKFGFTALEEKIDKINVATFRDTIEWQNRIAKLKEIVLKEI